MIAQANRTGEVQDPVISHAAPKTMAMMAARFFPVLRKARVLRSWTAATTFTDDGCPLLGPVNGIEGLILAASYRSAVIQSPLSGEVVTQLITIAAVICSISVHLRRTGSCSPLRRSILSKAPHLPPWNRAEKLPGSLPL